MDGSVIRVALVEDHDLLRSLLAERLRREDGLVLGACAATAAEALRLVTPGSADVALLDIGLPDGNGIALGVKLQRTDPRLRVLLLSAQDALGSMLASQASAATPWSYLSKRSALAAEHLAETVRAVAEGQVVIDPEVVRIAVPRRGPLAALSATQTRVLRMVAQGLTNAAVAQMLGTTAKSVEAHLTATYRLLEVDTTHNPRVAAVLAYQRHGDPPPPVGGQVDDAP